MKFNLFLEFYKSNDDNRQKELDECLFRNIKNEYINQIHLFQNINDNFELQFNSEKIKIIKIKERLKYSIVFDYSNSICDDQYTINCLINADIILTNDINKFLQDNIFYDFKSKRIIFALSRHEGIEETTSTLCEQSHVSQDAWIWQNKIELKYPFNGDFSLGKPGCDNLIVSDFLINNYNPINCATQIKILHNHKSNIRTWNVNERIKKHYGYTGLPVTNYPNFQYFRDHGDVPVEVLRKIRK